MDALRSLLSQNPPKPAKSAGGKKRRAKGDKPAKRARQGPKREMTAAEILREAELRG
jgi:hypothetical protein